MSQSHAESDRFLRSADGIEAFSEPDDPRQVNKLGHALHIHDSVFRERSHDPRLRQICSMLDMAAPQLVQSMLIFKPPQVGGAVHVHQDATYLRSHPSQVLGFWLALQDAHRQNGCLWVLPGHHQNPTPRTTFGWVEGQLKQTTHDARPWPLDAAIPLEVTAGTLVVLHGHLPHFSHANRSTQPRAAFTLHVVDGTAQWLPDNWLQRDGGFPPV